MLVKYRGRLVFCEKGSWNCVSLFFFFSERLHFCESARLLIPSTYAAYNVNLITRDNSAFFMSFFHFFTISNFHFRTTIVFNKVCVVFVYLLFYSEETEKKSLFFSLELKQRELDFRSNSTYEIFWSHHWN